MNKIKFIDNLLKGWLYFLIAISIFVTALTLIFGGDVLRVLISIPAELLIFYGIPSFIWYLIKRKFVQKPKEILS